jgi:hypothetical protein
MLIVMGQSGHRTLRKAASSHASVNNEQKISNSRKHLIEVLSELHELLEDYSPVWYTEEHHRMLESVLQLERSTELRSPLQLQIRP